MRQPRTTVALPKPLAAWVKREAEANGMSTSAYVIALVLRAKGEQTAEFEDAYLRHERALRAGERLFCELAGTVTQLPGFPENAKRRVGEAFVAVGAALDGREAA